VCVEGLEIGPTRTIKGSQPTIIWFLMKQSFKGSGKIKDFGGKAVDQVCGSEESFILKFKGHMCMSRQR
jgi:hypothetical protein